MSDPAKASQVPSISLIPAEMYHALTVAHAEVARLRLTDEERQAIAGCVAYDEAAAATLRKLLERLK